MLIKIIRDLSQNPQAVPIVIRVLDAADGRRLRPQRPCQLRLGQPMAFTKFANLSAQRQLLPRPLQLGDALRPASVEPIKKNFGCFSHSRPTYVNNFGKSTRNPPRAV